MTYAEAQLHEEALVRHASETVDIFMQAWYDLKTHPSWNGNMSTSSDQHVALAVLLARQIRFLDGARGAALAGSPDAVTALGRSMFETWLSVLAISFVRTRLWTPEELGQRFLAHNEFLLQTRAQSMRKDLLALAEKRHVDRRVALSLLRELEGRSKLPAGSFKSTSDPWYPFKDNGRFSLQALALALWPKGRGRRFPARLFPLGRRQWREQVNLFWGVPSATVHTTGLVASRYMRPDEMGLVQDGRMYEAEGLLRAIDFTGRSVQAVSIVAGMEREWEMTSYQCYRHCEHIRSQLRPYLAIEMKRVLL